MQEPKPTPFGPGTRESSSSRGLWPGLPGDGDEFTKSAQRVPRGPFPCKALGHCQGGGAAGAAPRWGPGLRTRPLQSVPLGRAEKGARLGEPQREASKPPGDALLPTRPRRSLVAELCHAVQVETASSPSPWGAPSSAAPARPGSGTRPADPRCPQPRALLVQGVGCERGRPAPPRPKVTH